MKETLRNKIESGLREYLTITFPYDKLGLNRNDFVTKEEIAKILNLEVCNDYEELSVGEYIFYDPSEVKYGVKKFVKLQFTWHFLTDSGEVFDNDKECPFIIKNDGRYFLCETIEGFRNPKWDVDNDEPYWFEEPFFGWYDDEIEKPLQSFINETILSTNLFSGNIGFQFVSGKKCECDNELVKELSPLANLCKSICVTITDKGIDVCFAIRYKDYVDEFLDKIVKILNKYDIKL